MRTFLAFLSLAILLPAVILWPGWSASAGAGIVWAARWDTPIYSSPNLAAPLLTRVDLNQPLSIIGGYALNSGESWQHIWLWNALDGYVRTTDVADMPHSRYVPSGYPIGAHPTGPHIAMPLWAVAQVDIQSNLRAAPTISTRSLALLSAHTVIRVIGWATDSAGRVWYHTIAPVSGQGRYGWILGDLVTFHSVFPMGKAAARLLQPIQGLGMWATYNLLDVAPVQAIVQAAVRNGVTHLYVEVGRSGSNGFYGASGLARLLPVAHRAGLRVIAWVYPFLNNMPADVQMTVDAARYTAPSGEHVDGLMADIEQNMTVSAVKAYSQIVRALLGPQELLGAATYPPHGSWRRNYPFKTVAASWNVIAPMAYWHVQRRSYSAAEVGRYIDDSVTGIRQLTGNPNQAIDVAGQTYNPWQDGLHDPTSAEIVAAVAAARSSHAMGISFFEWNHATPAQWSVLAHAWP